MTHSYVAFNVKRRWSREAKSFHIRIDLRLEYSTVWPWATEAWNKLVINWTTKLVDELDPLRCTIMSVTVNLNYFLWCYWQLRFVQTYQSLTTISKPSSNFLRWFSSMFNLFNSILSAKSHHIYSSCKLSASMDHQPSLVQKLMNEKQ